MQTYHSREHISETNFLINYFENPDGENIDFDCPVIDPNDPEWCPENSNGEYYRVECKIHFFKNQIYSGMCSFSLDDSYFFVFSQVIAMPIIDVKFIQAFLLTHQNLVSINVFHMIWYILLYVCFCLFYV